MKISKYHIIPKQCLEIENVLQKNLMQTSRTSYASLKSRDREIHENGFNIRKWSGFLPANSKREKKDKKKNR